MAFGAERTAMTILSVINENAEKRLHPTPNDRYSAHQHNRSVIQTP
jgi:hypothetical protein